MGRKEKRAVSKLRLRVCERMELNLSMKTNKQQRVIFTLKIWGDVLKIKTKVVNSELHVPIKDSSRMMKIGDYFTI